MAQQTLTQVAEYVKLAEASYADFSKKTLSTQQAIMEKDENDPTDMGDKSKEKFAESIVKNWTVEAHWKDSGNIINSESGFSATLFKGSNDEYVLAFRGSNGFFDDGGKDFIIADAGDIVLDGFALKQSIDLINFRQQLLGEDGKAYKVLTLQTDEISEIHRQLNSGTLRPQKPEEIDAMRELAEKLKQALDSGQYIKDGGDLYKMEWVNSDEYYGKDDDRATGKGLSWDKITITGHSLGGNLSAIYSTWFANEVENTVTVNGAGFHKSVLNEENNNFNNIAAQLKDNAYSSSGNQESLGYSNTKVGDIFSIIADKGINMVAQDGVLLYQPDQIGRIFVEELKALGHSVSPVSDTMSVMSLFAKASVGWAIYCPRC